MKNHSVFPQQSELVSKRKEQVVEPLLTKQKKDSIISQFLTALGKADNHHYRQAHNKLFNVTSVKTKDTLKRVKKPISPPKGQPKRPGVMIRGQSVPVFLKPIEHTSIDSSKTNSTLLRGPTEADPLPATASGMPQAQTLKTYRDRSSAFFSSDATKKFVKVQEQSSGNLAQAGIFSCRSKGSKRQNPMLKIRKAQLSQRFAKTNTFFSEGRCGVFYRHAVIKNDVGTSPMDSDKDLFSADPL